MDIGRARLLFQCTNLKKPRMTTCSHPDQMDDQCFWIGSSANIASARKIIRRFEVLNIFY